MTMPVVTFRFPTGARIEWRVLDPMFTRVACDGTTSTAWEWMGYQGDDFAYDWSIGDDDRALLNMLHDAGGFFGASPMDDFGLQHLMQHLVHFSYDDRRYGGTAFVNSRGIAGTFREAIERAVRAWRQCR